MATVYQHQVEHGQWFIHEHSAGASSGSLKEIQKILNMNEVDMVKGDQCMYELKTWSMNGKMDTQAKKRMSFMSNSKEILKELVKKYDGNQHRQKPHRGSAKDAERYTDGLCRAICVGLMKEIRNGEMKIMKLIDVGADTKMENNLDDYEENIKGYERAWDDVSGEELDPGEVKKARDKEMKYIEEKGVWKVVARDEAVRREVKIIKTKWIDINKGDRANPNCRSRLVAKEFRDGNQEGLFASTPIGGAQVADQHDCYDRPGAGDRGESHHDQ